MGVTVVAWLYGPATRRRPFQTYRSLNCYAVGVTADRDERRSRSREFAYSFPRCSEVDAGVPPGNDRLTFETRFDTVGMMACCGGFFPDVARELANRGAEVIAWPAMRLQSVAGPGPCMRESRLCQMTLCSILLASCLTFAILPDSN